MSKQPPTAADIMMASIPCEQYLDGYAVAAVDLVDGEQRIKMAKALRAREAVLIAPQIYALQNPIGILMMRQYDVEYSVPVPPPHVTAAAICRQNGWKISLPLPFAQFLLGLAERPIKLPELPYNQNEMRTYTKASVALIPGDQSVFGMSVAGQALTIALPREASEPRLKEIGRLSARGPLGLPEIIGGLKQDIDAGLLGEREIVAARAILGAAGDLDIPLRAPADWVPPVSDKAIVRIENWWVRRMEDGGGRYYCLAADKMTGHPVLGNTRLAHSSPLVWLDEKLGYARTVSRVYRLGQKSMHVESQL